TAARSPGSPAPRRQHHGRGRARACATPPAGQGDRGDVPRTARRRGAEVAPLAAPAPGRAQRPALRIRFERAAQDRLTRWPVLGFGGRALGYRQNMKVPAVSAVADPAGRYSIERTIGRGGMAKVYLARDRELERLVALKVLAPELAADDSA